MYERYGDEEEMSAHGAREDDQGKGQPGSSNFRPQGMIGEVTFF